MNFVNKIKILVMTNAIKKFQDKGFLYILYEMIDYIVNHNGGAVVRDERIPMGEEGFEIDQIIDSLRQGDLRKYNRQAGYLGLETLDKQTLDKWEHQLPVITQKNYEQATLIYIDFYRWLHVKNDLAKFQSN